MSLVEVEDQTTMDDVEVIDVMPITVDIVPKNWRPVHGIFLA